PRDPPSFPHDALPIFAAQAVQLGHLQPERVISFLATIVLLYQPLKNLGGTGQGVTQGLAGAQRLFEVLDEPAGFVEGTRELPRLDRKSTRLNSSHVAI